MHFQPRLERLFIELIAKIRDILNDIERVDLKNSKKDSLLENV